MTAPPPSERWIWVELIGFDNTQSDYGVAEYARTAGFVPDAVCLLVSSSDFVLLHQGMEAEYPLAPDICSREGHTHNQQRQRQGWTNHQVRGLVDALRRAGVKVFLSFFLSYFSDRHHHEWASNHKELLSRHSDRDGFGSLNVLKRFKDGTWLEDHFIEKVLAAVEDYGFDGWHGPDGHGPLCGSIYSVDFSDDYLDQFEKARGIRLPEAIWQAGQETCAGRTRRAEHIWREHRRDWIEFFADRWARFWGKMMTRLHAAGKLGVINSAWTRAPWEALYRYGVDYRKFADAGVDAMVVETCAASLSMDPRPSTRDPVRSYDMYSMLGLIRAFAPGMKLVYLQTTQDIVERWDAIRHAPMVLEREVYNVSNVYLTQPDGSLRRAADGALTCLGDGMSSREWETLGEWVGLALDAMPKRILGATLVWSDAAVYNQIDDFTRWRTWNIHRILFSLQELGAPVQSVVRSDQLEGAAGPLLVLNPHLFTPEELRRLSAYDRGPVILVGPEAGEFPDATLLFSDAESVRPLQCAIRGGSHPGAPARDDTWAPEPVDWPEDDRGLIDKTGYWDRLTVRPVSRGFLAACTDAIWTLVSAAEGGLALEEERDAVTGMFMELESGVLRIALKNKMPWYANPKVTVPRTIARAEIKTDYPMMALQPDGNTFQVRVPGKGLTVVDVFLG